MIIHRSNLSLNTKKTECKKKFTRVEAWVAQVISYGVIDEGNSNTSRSV